MPFPLSWSGFVRTGVTSNATTAVLADALAEAGATEVVVEDGVLTFQVPWKVTRGPLWFMSSGRLETGRDAPGQVRYKLWFYRSASLAALLTYGWVAGVGMPGEPLAARFLGGTVLFLLLFGIWYHITPLRFERLVRRALRAGEVQKPVAEGGGARDERARSE